MELDQRECGRRASVDRWVAKEGVRLMGIQVMGVLRMRSQKAYG
jgi:hypothetical protein